MTITKYHQSRWLQDIGERKKIGLYNPRIMTWIKEVFTIDPKYFPLSIMTDLAGMNYLNRMKPNPRK